MNKKLIHLDFEGIDSPNSPPKPTPRREGPDIEAELKRGLKIYTHEEHLERSGKRLERRGRKPIHSSKRRKPTAISLSPIEKRELKVIGEGSLTAGVRYLVMAYRHRDLPLHKPRRPPFRIGLQKSHLTKIDPKTNRPYSPCPECGKPRYLTPSGLACDNGHGGD